MKKRNLLQRSIVIAIVTLVGLYIVIGPHGRRPHARDFTPSGIKENLAQNIHLGLDLKGGSHLVMRVKVEEFFKKLCEESAIAAQNAAKEAGFENFVVDIWYGILAPAATPPNLISRLNTEISKALASPDLKDKLLAAGIQPTGGSPEHFGSFIRSETVRFSKVIKDAGIKPE